MKRRQLLLSLALLPTIKETLEDSVSHGGLPALPTSSSSSSCSSPSLQSPQTLDDYMTSIQALARPTEAAPGRGPVRLQRSQQRLRLFSKASQMKASASSMPRGSPRALRTPRLASSSSSLSLSAHEEFSPTGARERDPVDWLFGQSQVRT